MIEPTPLPPSRPETPALQVDGDFVAGDKYVTQHAAGDLVSGDKIVYHQPVTIVRARLDHVYLAPSLPPHFVARPEASAPLKEQLLAPPAGAAGALSLSALHGLPGIGKSTLAAALAHDPEVQARFPQGVLWVTLGQQPDLLSLLSGWIRALGDGDIYPTTAGAATSHLRALLNGRAALLVIDDAWDAAHVRPFLVGGPVSHVLLTTRRANVVDKVGAALHTVLSLTPEQSLTLLANRLRRELRPDEREPAQRLARAVGWLPIALEQAAARVLRGVAWDDLAASLEAEIARLEVLQGPRQEGLEAFFKLSFDALRASHPAAWEGFAWLGVLPEDVLLAAPGAAVLWGLSPAEADERLELLWNDALLLPGMPVQVGDRRWNAYRLHDLLHDMARRLLAAPPPEGLGLSLPQAHAALLERYRRQAPDQAWHRLTPDGYIHGRLAWHLERAGLHAELHRLLCPPVRGRHAWYAARESLGQVGGFMEDLARGWALAEQAARAQLGAAGAAQSFALEVRYAFTAASILNLARNLPPRLVAQLVADQVWSQEQGLSYARAIHAPVARVLLLAELLPRLAGVHQPAVQADLLLDLERVRLADIVTAFNPSHGRFLASYYGGLDPGQTVPARLEEALFLLSVAAGLPPPQQDRVRASGVQRLVSHLAAHPHPPADDVQRLLPYLAPAELLLLLQHSRKPIDASRLRSVADHHKARLNQLALEALLLARLTALSGRGSALEGVLAALEAAVSALTGWDDDTSRGIRLAVQALAPLASAGQLERLSALLEGARYLGQVSRSLAWACLAAHAADPFRARALERLDSALDGLSSRHFSDDDARAFHQLLPLLARLRGPDRALQLARQADDPLSADGLAALAPALPDALRPAVLRQELSTILAIGDQAAAWEAVAEWLRAAPAALDPDPVLDEALTRARQAPSLEHGLRALSALIPLMSPRQLEETLALAAQTGPFERAATVRACARRFAALGQPQRAVAVVLAHGDVDFVEDLRDLLRVLADPPALEAVLASVDQVRHAISWESLIGDLSLRWLELGDPDAAWRAIQKLDPHRDRDALLLLARQLARRGQAALAAQIHQWIGAPPDPWWPAEGQPLEHPPHPSERRRAAGLLPSLEPGVPVRRPLERLPPADLQDRLESIRAMRDDNRYKAEALLRLAEQVPARDLPALFEAAAQLPDPYARARALTRLCQHLDGAERVAHLRPALAAAAAIEDFPGFETEEPEGLDPSWTLRGRERSQVLGEAALLLQPLPEDQALALVQGVLHHLVYRGRSDLSRDLRALQPYLLKLLGPTCAAQVIAALLDVTAWWP
jgi:hypothetical protein